MSSRRPGGQCGVSVAAERGNLVELLASQGLLPACAPAPPVPGGDGDARWSGCRVRAWAASGAMWLTGPRDGPPIAPDGPVLARLAAAGAVLAGIAGRFGPTDALDVAAVLTGRAALLGLRRGGRTAAGGSCRLLRTADGWVALNLARPEDREAVPAIIGASPTAEPWTRLRKAAGSWPAEELAARAQLVGVPAAAVPPSRRSLAGAVPFRVQQIGPVRPGPPVSPPTVVDLSGMWAGPLCAHLLGRAGARVIKVESTSRPDGARRGPALFFDWLHAGHESVALDLSSPAGAEVLRALLRVADVVLEASRPRALAQLGIDPGEVVAAGPGRTWVSITGYGRQGPWSNRVAFGDDAAAGGGLLAWDERNTPAFCADAIADPVAGVFAALGAAAAYATGGGRLVDVSMRDAAAYVASAPSLASDGHPVGRRGRRSWIVTCETEGTTAEIVRPRWPVGGERARPLGADTRRVLGEVGVPT